MGCGSSKGATVDSQPKSGKPQSVKLAEDPVSYAKVDEHARKAPNALRNSANELVAYLSKPSSEPKMVVRAIFVWVAENITYDTDGYFGRSAKAACDAESVMRGGSSMCAGYADVMELLCREAGIPVKKISGYAKGYSSSTEKPFSTSENTNHEWNAVELGGKWFLLDSTWGAGGLGENATFEKKFNEFYFLSDPGQFVCDHFPYIDGDMEASKKWQLLKNTVSLEEFNKSVVIKSSAFELGVRPVSHKEGLICVNDEVKLAFTCDGKDEVLYITRLMHKQDNKMYERPDNIYNQLENGVFTTCIHPHTTGTFELKIFGRKASDEGTFPLLFVYVIKCEKAGDDNFSYPYTFTQSQRDRCALVEPLQGKLNQNSTVNWHITSPYLNRVMINKTYLEKSGSSFKGVIKTGPKGETMTVYGSREDSGRLNGLYKFEIV